MNQFPLTELAVKMYCPDNVIVLDDAGLPSIMVYIPAFKNSDVLNGGDDSTHPAFIVNGKQIDGFYYSKYQNVSHNGKAYSLPGEDPQGGLTFDMAHQCCEAKGEGWHLSTNAEWAAIALWCRKNGILPRGNNNNGKDYQESEYKAVSTYKDDQGRTNRVATGTGPVTWSHDQTPSGIWDMNGNGWEWQGGVRIVWGELQILSNNDAANSVFPQNNTSTYWKAINASDGTLVEPECQITDTAPKLSGNTVRLDYIDDTWKYCTSITNVSTDARNCKFANVTHDGISTAAIALLRSLALLPDEGWGASVETADDTDCIMSCTNGVNERLMTRGGVFYMVKQAGVFHINLACTRTAMATVYCFRSAYIPHIPG